MRVTCAPLLGGLLAALTFMGSAAAAPAIDGAWLPSPSVKGPPMAIEHVTVLPMSGEAEALRDMTVVIRDARIVSIAPTRQSPPPKDVRRVDGAGKFLMPGLSDMHVHPANDRFMRMMSGVKTLPSGLYDTGDEYLPYVANGVLQILNMSAMSEAIGQRQEIETGRALGPHMGLAAMVDGRPSLYPMGHGVATPQDGRQAVRDLKSDGFDYIKTYSALSLETFTAVVDEARINGMKALGHIPGRLLGQTDAFFQPNYTMVAHADEFALQGVATTPGALCTRTGCSASDADIPGFVAMAKRNGTWLESTLSLDERLLGMMTDANALKGRTEFRYLNPMTVYSWTAQNSYMNSPMDRVERQKRIVDLNGKIVRAFAEAGIPVLPGTDTGVAGMAAGFALHDELEAMARAGLSSRQILVAATRQSAEWLGVDGDRGTVEVGKRADLLLLDADPMADVANTRKITAVISSGRYYSRPELDRRMAALAAKYAAMPPPITASKPGGGHYDEDE